MLRKNRSAYLRNSFLSVLALIAMAFLFCLMVLIPKACAVDRCIEYVQDVRVEHIKQFGLMFPWHYGVGQLRAESNCRSTVTAFDGGQGPAQFMPATSTYIQGLMGEKLNPRDPEQAVRMQAFYLHRIHALENWTPALWISYGIYNSGKTVLYNEWKRAGILDWDLMKLECRRKKVVTPKGYVLDFCVSGYDYPKKIEKYGNQYRRGPDGMRYW